ncbi:hypothetical protein ElyMa_004503800 [Elysia marginata]|uniref:Uncharacterized protein n=1 Tax=Elysia marginata TaxID=1093978 RepID=A0AAV4HP68_9GAST|nr:hypothetical protein ElyMa_004503800 [Elysia marginata]
MLTFQYHDTQQAVSPTLQHYTTTTAQTPSSCLLGQATIYGGLGTGHFPLAKREKATALGISSDTLEVTTTDSQCKWYGSLCDLFRYSRSHNYRLPV